MCANAIKHSLNSEKETSYDRDCIIYMCAQLKQSDTTKIKIKSKKTKRLTDKSSEQIRLFATKSKERKTSKMK